jgi:hypothetical protein
MSNAFGTFDSARVAALHAKTLLAVAELQALRCADVAAAEAMAAVKLAVHTLEHWWLPALEPLAPATHPE